MLVLNVENISFSKLHSMEYPTKITLFKNEPGYKSEFRYNCWCFKKSTCLKLTRVSFAFFHILTFGSSKSFLSIVKIINIKIVTLKNFHLFYKSSEVVTVEEHGEETKLIM